MNKQRLLDVIQALEELPLDQFDMNHWKCGTTCCAVGAYCLKFPGRGLNLVPGRIEGHMKPIMDGEAPSFDSVANHFDIPISRAFELFGAGNYQQLDNSSGRLLPEVITPDMVINRIREFVESTPPDSTKYQ